MKTKFIILGIALAGIFPASLALAAQGASAANSYNWAGYAAENGAYSAVTGSWTVPAVPPSTAGAGDAAWIGIGGFQSGDLVQTGTRAHSENGVVSYEAWYELLPAPAVPLSMSVHAGDTMSASIVLVSKDLWRITLADETSGATVSETLAYHSSESSAEWIAEAPGTGGAKLLPLDRFGSVAFTGASATVGSAAESLAALGATRLTLVNASSTALATPSPLAASGSAFSILRD